MFAYVHEKINILLSCFEHLLLLYIYIYIYIFFFFFFFFMFYYFHLNTQDFEHLEFVKYQLSFHRNVQVFVECYACKSAIQLFYKWTCPDFLHVSK